MTAYIPFLTLPEYLYSNPVVAVLFPLVLGMGVGFTVGTDRVQRRYQTLKQPPLRPPPWIFAPVWTVLYGLMGYAAYRAWNTGMTSINPRLHDLAKQGATLYTIQLGLNQLYMPLFFGYAFPIAATVDIVSLTGVVAYLTYIWGQIDSVAAYALVPYVAWLTFATYLNCAIVYLNGYDLLVDSSINRRRTDPRIRDRLTKETWE